jgi:hypothetical protein
MHHPVHISASAAARSVNRSATPSTSRPGRLRQTLVLLGFMLALLWAQMLGLAHGVRHVHALQAHVVLTGAHAAPQGVLEHLAAPAGEAQDCRLYDQLGQGGPLLLLSLLPLLQPLPQALAWAVLQTWQPQPCIVFAARAPPALR